MLFRPFAESVVAGVSPGTIAGRMGDDCVPVSQLASVVFGTLVGEIPLGAACRFLAYLADTLVAFPNPLLQNLLRYSLLPFRLVPQREHRLVSPDRIVFPPLL